MIKINSKTLKYLKNSSGNFAWQFKKGQAKELKIRQDREREGDGESLGSELCEELSHSSVPFLQLYLCFFLSPAFSGEFASYIFFVCPFCILLCVLLLAFGFIPFIFVIFCWSWTFFVQLMRLLFRQFLLITFGSGWVSDLADFQFRFSLFSSRYP